MRIVRDALTVFLLEHQHVLLIILDRESETQVQVSVLEFPIRLNV
jgi:hypothetical protein